MESVSDHFVFWFILVQFMSATEIENITIIGPVNSDASKNVPIIMDQSPGNGNTEEYPDRILQDQYDQTNDERRLLNHLMRNYEKNVRPVKDATSPIVVRLGITLTQIFDLDEKNQVLTTNIWLDQEWVDDFLTWNVTQFGNITKIRIPCELIWLPDIVLYNRALFHSLFEDMSKVKVTVSRGWNNVFDVNYSADDYTRGYMNSRAIVEPNGNIFWSPPTKFRSTCPVDVTYFPFDDQTCYMKFGSWIYDGFQIDLCNRTTEVDLENYVHNGEWDLLEAKLNRNVVQFPCCIEPFPDIKVMLTIRRKTLYYMYNIVLPCMMMSILTLLVFCLPPDSGEKVALGVTVLLAFSVIMLAISEKLPETSESIPLLGIYLTTVMAITSVSVIMTVIVLNFHYRGPTQSEMPNWLKKFLLQGVVQKAIKFPKTTEYAKDIFEANASFSTNFPANPGVSGLFSGLKANRNPNLVTSIPLEACNHFTGVDCLREDLMGGVGLEEGRESKDSENGGALLNERRPKPPFGPSTSATNGEPNKASSSLGGLKQNSSRPQDEILLILKYLLWRQELEDQHNKVVHEWRLLAQAIDKVLFWIFLIITLTSSLSFLVIIPIQRRGFSLASIRGGP